MMPNDGTAASEHTEAAGDGVQYLVRLPGASSSRSQTGLDQGGGVSGPRRTAVPERTTPSQLPGV